MTTRQDLHEAIDKLTDDQVKQVIQAVKPFLDVNPYELLKGTPGIRVPDHWPPRYHKFEPIEISQEGERPSEQLVRERR
jgi:hypothetical protein